MEAIAGPGAEEKAGPGERAGRFLDDWAVEVLGAASAGCLALASSWGGYLIHDKVAWEPLIRSVGVVFAVLAGIATKVRRDRSERLRTKGQDAEQALVEAERSERRAKDKVEDAVSTYTVNLMQRLGLGAAERLTVYVFVDETGFLRVHRRSENRTFLVGGRTQYAEGEGFLSVAWQDPVGEVFRRDCPNPAADLGKYRDFHVANGLSEESVADLTMPSRCFYGIAVYGPNKAERVGVAMFESTRPRGLESVRKNLTDSDRVSLGLLTVLLRPEAQPTGEDGEPL